VRRIVVAGLLAGLVILGTPSVAVARHQNHCHYGWDNWGYNYRGSHYHYGSWRYDHGPENCAEDES
jgi:hypothetical protein